MRQRNGQQGQNQGADRHREAPGQLATAALIPLSHQLDRGTNLAAAFAQRLQALVNAHPVTLKLHHPEILAAGLALVAAAMLQQQKRSPWVSSVYSRPDWAKTDDKRPSLSINCTKILLAAPASPE